MVPMARVEGLAFDKGGKNFLQEIHILAATLDELHIPLELARATGLPQRRPRSL